MPHYTYKNQDITIDILMKIEHVVRILAEKHGKSFDEMLQLFYASKTFAALKNTESCMWAESAEFIADDFEREKIRLIVNNLRKNPVFRMSLASKELFHSNMLAWLLESRSDDENNQPSEIAQALAKLFMPDYTVLTVLRERGHFDLLVVLLPAKDYNDTIKSNLTSIADFFQNLGQLPEVQEDLLKSCKFAVVENKFKSIPNKNQLEKYKKKAKIKFSKKIKMDDGNTTYYLLAPLVSLDNFEQCDGWERISWDKILDVLSKTKEKRDPFTATFMKYYADFLDNMLKLTKNIEEKLNSTDKPAFPDWQDISKLKKIRIHDFYVKLWFSVLLNKIKEQISTEKLTLSEIGYTNTWGLLDFRVENKNIKNDDHVSYGIQIQQGQFRLLVVPASTKETKYRWKDDSCPVEEIKIYFGDVLRIMNSEREKEKGNEFTLVEPKTKEGLCSYGDFKYKYIKLENQSIAELTAMINNAVNAIYNSDKKTMKAEEK